MEAARRIEPGFSTADAEMPALQFDGEILTANFRDWKDCCVTVRFNGTYAFRWQGIENLLEDAPYDGSCEILESRWLDEHICQAIVSSKEKSHHHYQFNFNGAGSLDVICSTYEVETN